MGEVSTIGLDLARHVFQVHGVDDRGKLNPTRTSLTSVLCRLRKPAPAA